MVDEIKYDKFGDVVRNNRGIFGDALEEHDKVEARPMPDGVHVEFQCEGCGSSTRVVIEWPEIIAMRYMVNPIYAFRGRPDIVQSPMSWTYNVTEQAWMPEARCQHKCNFFYGIRVLPQEPARWLEAARRGGFAYPHEEAISKGCAALAQQAAQRPR